MMQLDNFLAGLKRQDHHHNGKTSNHTTRNVFFMLNSKQDGSIWVNTVDNKMHHVDADYRDMNGEEATVMRNMERIREREMFRVEWDADTTDTEGINISNTPQLLYQLVRCNNLVDADGQPISVNQESTHAIISLRPSKQAKNTILEPKLSLACGYAETQNDDNRNQDICT